MDFDFTSYFKKYEELVSKADDAFERVKQAYAECVKCEEKCTDCCYALFDLTLIEALYINYKFNEKIKGSEKEAALLEKANQADRRAPSRGQGNAGQRFRGEDLKGRRNLNEQPSLPPKAPGS